MTSDRLRTLEQILAQAAAAHGVYEATELNGVYDQEWPRWYAGYAVEHAIGDVLGRDVSVDELASFLARKWDEQKRTDPRSTEPWATYTARQIATELSLPRARRTT